MTITRNVGTAMLMVLSVLAYLGGALLPGAFGLVAPVILAGAASVYSRKGDSRLAKGLSTAWLVLTFALMAVGFMLTVQAGVTTSG